MRLAFFTPFHPACGPGFMSKAVVERLKDYFDITVFYQWHEQYAPYAIEDVDVRVIENDIDMDAIGQSYDVVVYNLGNNEENHYSVIQCLKKLPGIVVLHDFVMQHGLVKDIFVRKNNPELYYWLLAALYGKEGVLASYISQVSHAGEVRGGWDSPSVTSFPLFEAFSGLASACVVHSRFFEDRLKPVFAGPVLRTRNPYDLKRVPSAEVIDTFYKVRGKAGGKVLFASFGHISPSKCLDRVLRVFGHSEVLRNNARLILCGGATPDYERYLRRLCAMDGLDECVEFRGSVSDAELYAIQVEADAFINLRQPNTEGQSGSLIEQLAGGKPVICYDTGCYSDLPNDAAYKVHSTADFNELQTVLERVLTDSADRHAVAKRGRDTALEYDCSRYARELFEFIFEHREYLKAFQQRDARPLRRYGLSGSVIDPRHPETYLRTKAIWGVLDGFVSHASAQAIAMIPPDAQAHYLSFLTGRYRPLTESLLEMVATDTPAGEGQEAALRIGDLSLYSTEAVPVLDTQFWERLDGTLGGRFVYICYKKLLCREPDQGGLRDYAERLGKGELTKKELILAIVRSTEFSERFANVTNSVRFIGLTRWAAG